jgi:citrate synthase
VAGSSEIAGRYIVEVLETARKPGSDLDTAARANLEALKAARAKVPGLGHSQHSAGDPRADTLLALADRIGVSGDHIACLRTIAKHAPAIMNRPLPINVSGAIPALMLDAGWPIAAMKGIPLLARAAGLVAHLYEESQRSIGFIMSHHGDLAISYAGPAAPAVEGTPTVRGSA